MYMKRTILIVDDDEAIRNTLVNILSNEYEVFTASNGKEAHDMLMSRQYMFSMMLVDVQMPVMDGPELIDICHRNRFFSEIPIMAMSDPIVSTEVEIQCLQLGAVDFVRKPVRAELLLVRVKNLVRMRERAMELSEVEFDRMTGLFTREAMFRRMKNLLLQYPEKKFDFAVIDIEHFGLVNQQYGAEMGNRVLRTVGRNLDAIPLEHRLVSRIRDDIFACFAVYGPEWNLAEPEEFTSRIFEDCPICNLQCKIGVYKDVDHSMPAEEICQNALAALDSIRNQFGTGVGMYDNHLIELQRIERQMELSFEKALAENEFELWLQPKYESDSQNICGAEALVRWRDAYGKLIPPTTFIPLFERDGLIRRLDEYVFREVCMLQRRLIDKKIMTVPISVNLSGASLYRTETARIYSEIVNEAGIDPSIVPIEITESMAIQSETAREFSDLLYKKGFSFHMDDFGSGYSSLASLQSLHFDVIKLDKSLIDYIGTPAGNSIIKHTIAFSKEAGMRVVAEGVETREQKDFLMKMGCDYIQGYYYSAPVTMQMYEKLLTDNATVLKEAEKEIKFSLLERKELLGIISNNMVEKDALNKIMGAVALCCQERGRFLFSAANEAFMDIFQIDPWFIEEQLHHSVINFVHYEDRARFKQMFLEAEHNPEKGAVVECRFTSRNKLHWCRVHCYYLRRSEGKDEYYLYVVDKTAAHFNDEILAGVPGGFLIYHADEQERIVFSNSQLWNIYGCETEEEFHELVGPSFRGMVYKDDYESVTASIKEQMQNNHKKLDYVEYRIQRKDGTLTTVADFGHLVHSEDGEDLFYVFLSEKSK